MISSSPHIQCFIFCTINILVLQINQQGLIRIQWIIKSAAKNGNVRFMDILIVLVSLSSNREQTNSSIIDSVVCVAICEPCWCDPIKNI